ncbi:MAG TPA: alpha/beta hydrolase [Flavisolibacter sp.]|jgi:acetyl esterase/lipase|nr:alpha/beta hydrolase [Flavisolibacter sp.]
MKQLFFSLLLFVFVTGCQKETNDQAQDNAEKTLLDVAYGSDPAQKMDVYLPANRNSSETKVLVLVHGGSWSSGDKTEFNEYIPVFKQRLPGYAIININYRLGQLPATNPFPTQETDVKAAFAAIVARAEEYKFNKEKLAALGVSAGAHLTLLQAYKNNSPKVKAVVDMFGPTDLVALYNNATTSLEQLILQALLSGTPATNAGLYESSSPINFVSAQSPHTLILQGGADPLVSPSQSTALKARLEAAGVPVQMILYPTEGHGWTGTNLTDSYNRIESFLKTYNP